MDAEGRATPPPRADPLGRAEAALLDGRPAALAEGLLAVDGALSTSIPTFDRRRALAYRAELLGRLGRRGEAAQAYATALGLDLLDGEAVLDGLAELLDRFGALEAVVALGLDAAAAQPGRRWRIEPLVAQARRRLELERTAPLDEASLSRLRTEVGRRLAALPPCAHDDATRPVTRAAAQALGLPVEATLRYVADLGACCCDCGVVVARGPREGGDTPPRA